MGMLCINWFTSSAGLTLTIPSGENCRDKKLSRIQRKHTRLETKRNARKGSWISTRFLMIMPLIMEGSFI